MHSQLLQTFAVGGLSRQVCLRVLNTCFSPHSLVNGHACGGSFGGIPQWHAAASEMMGITHATILNRDAILSSMLPTMFFKHEGTQRHSLYAEDAEDAQFSVNAATATIYAEENL